MLAVFLFCARQTFAQLPLSGEAAQAGLRVLVTDAQAYPLPGATVSVYREDAPSIAVATATTGEHGDAAFPAFGGGIYIVRIEVPGFDPYASKSLAIDGTERVELRAVLTVAAVAENVSVKAPGAASAGIEAGPVVPTTHLERQLLQRLPLAAARVDEALSILPGVIRSGTGEISMKGAAEQQNGLLINGLNAADPATGNFRLNLPVDSVEAVQVFLHPYTAEYGQFTGGLTTVETRPGGDRWRFEVNDFLPDLRVVGHKIVGIAEDSPRANVSGPILNRRMYLSQSLSYTIAKRPVRGLTFPFNETRTEGYSSFSQFDVNVSTRRTDTFTLGVFSERNRFVGLDVFRQQPVTPDARNGDLVAALRDRYQTRAGLLESAVSMRSFGTSVWPQGWEEHTLTPEGERGNYFATQDRSSARIELFEMFTLPTKKFLVGTHDIKFGFDFNTVSGRFDSTLRPVNIVREDGTLAERIEFEPVSTIRARDREAVAFVQDRWSVHHNFSFDIGLRYENQRLADGQGFAPRAGFVWAPSNDNSTVIRGGVGLFYDKVPLNIRSFSQYPARVETQYGPDGIAVVDRRRFTPLLIDAAAAAPFRSDHSESESAYVPENLTWNVQLDKTVSPLVALRVNFVSSSTDNIYIVNPQRMADGSDVIVLQSTGRSAYRALETTARISPRKGTFYLTYVRSSARGDLNDFNSSFGDFAEPVIRPNQFSRLPVDVPHRFLAWGTFALPRRFALSPIVEIRSGFPYSVRDGEQRFIGVRNADATRFPRFFALDLEAAKDVQVTKKYAVRLSVRGFNLTNHFNPRDVRANLGDPKFGEFLASYRRYFAGGFDIIF